MAARVLTKKENFVVLSIVIFRFWFHLKTVLSHMIVVGFERLWFAAGLNRSSTETRVVQNIYYLPLLKKNTALKFNIELKKNS